MLKEKKLMMYNTVITSEKNMNVMVKFERKKGGTEMIQAGETFI